MLRIARQAAATPASESGTELDAARGGRRPSRLAAYWSAHKAFCQTWVGELMAALLDELSGEFDAGPIARPVLTVPANVDPGPR